jgi:hypothetical protein
LVVSGRAYAGPALDDTASQPAAGAPASVLTAPEPTEKELPVEYGVGIRLRSVYVPKSVLELFVDRAADGAHNYGYGIDVTRRRGDVELQLGVEFEHVNVGEGVWINRGDTVPQDSVDYLLSPKDSGKDFGWFTIDFTFFHHAKINQYVAFRYGAGLGLGILTGEIDHYNVVCAAGSTNSNVDPGCIPPEQALGGHVGGKGTDEDGKNFQQTVKYDTPPVFPVVNAIIGFQLRPTEKLSINIEGGIRTLPFFGVEASYFF